MIYRTSKVNFLQDFFTLTLFIFAYYMKLRFKQIYVYLKVRHNRNARGVGNAIKKHNKLIRFTYEGNRFFSRLVAIHHMVSTFNVLSRT